MFTEEVHVPWIRPQLRTTEEVHVPVVADDLEMDYDKPKTLNP